MKQAKRLLALLLAVVLCFSSVPFAMAADGEAAVPTDSPELTEPVTQDSTEAPKRTDNRNSKHISSGFREI